MQHLREAVLVGARAASARKAGQGVRRHVPLPLLPLPLPVGRAARDAHAPPRGGAPVHVRRVRPRVRAAARPRAARRHSHERAPVRLPDLPARVHAEAAPGGARAHAHVRVRAVRDRLQVRDAAERAHAHGARRPGVRGVRGADGRGHGRADGVRALRRGGQGAGSDRGEGEAGADGERRQPASRRAHVRDVRHAVHAVVLPDATSARARQRERARLRGEERVSRERVPKNGGVSGIGRSTDAGHGKHVVLFYCDDR